MAASRINATNCLIGAKTKITITRDSALYRHTLSWTCGNLSGTFVTKTLLQTYSATIPESIYSLIPNRQTATVTIRCDTFSGSTNIGYDTINITVTADASKCKPVITYSSLIDTNAPTVTFSGSSLKCVANESKMTVSGVSTRFPISGDTATIVSLKLRCGAKEANIVNGSASIAKAPSGNMRLVAVDSRDFESSLPLNAETIYYESPVIYGKFYRPIPTSDTIKVDYSGNFYYETGIQTNVAHVYYGVPHSQVIGEWEWTEIALPTVTVPPGPQTTGYAKDNITIGTAYDYRNEFRFKLKVVDGLHAVESKEYSVTRGTPMFDWGPYGSGFNFNFNADITFDSLEQTDERTITFGNSTSAVGEHPHSVKIYGGSPTDTTAFGIFDESEFRDILKYNDSSNILTLGDSDTTVRLGGSDSDYVLQFGTTSDGWRYKKWNSGWIEAWTTVSGTVSSWSTWGAMYYGDVSLDYSSLNLVNTPRLFFTPYGNVYFFIAGYKSVNSSSTTVGIARPTNTQNAYQMVVYLISTWK